MINRTSRDLITGTFRYGRRFVQFARLLRNWPAVWVSGHRNGGVTRLEMRNGAILTGPPQSHLDYLFNDIWIERAYDRIGAVVEVDDVVIDIGANIGVFSIYAATRARGVTVYAYEPASEPMKWLRRNVADSGLNNISIFECAVAGSVGQRRFYSHDSNWIVGGLRDDSIVDRGSTVDCVRLDDVLAANHIERCDLLKLDCEGSEYEILESAADESLRRIRTIAGEYHKPPEGGEGRSRLHQVLAMRGFQIERLIPSDSDTGLFCARNTAALHV